MQLDWLKILREIGSLALVGYVLIFGLADLNRSIDALATSSAKLQQEVAALTVTQAQLLQIIAGKGGRP